MNWSNFFFGIGFPALAASFFATVGILDGNKHKMWAIITFSLFTIGTLSLALGWGLS
jgi:hypothetical protein